MKVCLRSKYLPAGLFLFWVYCFCPRAEGQRTSFSAMDALPAHTDTASVRASLAERFPYFSDRANALQLVYVRNSGHAIYFTYQQTFRGIPVTHTQIKICADLSGHVRDMSGSVVQTSGWENEIPRTDGFSFSLRPADPGDSAGTVQATIVCDSAGNPQLTYCADLFSLGNRQMRTEYFSPEGNLLFTDDHRAYFYPGDSTVTGRVFVPDPLTTAMVTYGGAYIDANDSDLTVLNDQRQEAAFVADYEAGTFYLRNTRIQIADLDEPTVPVATSDSPVFDFTRSEEGFEDVNAYYHLTHFSSYLDSIGFPGLHDFFIEVDPHGAYGGDQSFYAGGATPTIQYGEGGVDDAEDADVIIHEYGHALSDHASPGSNDGLERRALDEGYGDYFAVSYSRSYSDFNWWYVFSWDGHNEFWPGRDANTDKHYPEDLSPDYYATSEIWSGALMDIYDLIGKENCDKLVCETLYGSYVNMSLPDAALVLLQSENILFGGMYHDAVYDVLLARGLLSSTGIAGISQDADIRFYNTLGFASGRSPLQISLPPGSGASVRIFDVQGKLCYALAAGNAQTIEIPPGEVSPGLYVVEVHTTEQSASCKVLRLR